MKLVRTPVPGWNGTVGNVRFEDGQALVADDAQEMGHFRSAGYQVDDYDAAVEAAKDAEVPDEELERLDDLDEQAGTRDPDADNAPVVDDVNGDGVDETLPRRSASTDTWRRYAVAQGMSPDKVNSMSRDELVDHYTEKEDDR